MRRIDQNFTLKTIFYSYYVIGGVYLASEISRIIKILYFSIAAAAAILLCSTTITYYITAENVDLFDIITASCVIGHAMFFLIFFPLITYLSRSKFETLFSYLEKHETRQPLKHFKTENDYHTPKKISSIGEALSWTIFLFSILLLFMTVSLIDVLLVPHEENAVLDVNHHLMRAPYMNCNSTRYISYLLYAVEYSISMFSSLTCFCQVYCS